ncbi:MAG: hypothetical protein H7Y04_04670 [Verrucomicrobia bacterium]|nr:hypothetical protein [Cytophagales bacterium]
MIDWKKTLQTLPARSYRSVLIELAKLRKTGTERLPNVTVFLTSGQSISGSVVAFDRENQQETLVMHLSEYARYRNDLVYLDFSLVGGISLESVEEHIDLLDTLIGSSLKPQLSPINKLDLQRFMKSESAIFLATTNIPVEMDNAILQESQEVYAGVKEMSGIALKILNEIWQDALGKDALQTRVKKVIFGMASKAFVKLDLSYLLINFDKEQLTQGYFSETDLKTAIEKAL